MTAHNTLENLIQEHPILRQMAAGEPVCWTNPGLRPFAEAATDNPFGLEDALDAMSRLERFAPYIAQVFPETAERGGIIESPVREVPAMRARLEELWSLPLKGRLFLKLDSQLPISGSIKARGGFYEVMALAERLALKNGILKPGDCYSKLASPAAKETFGRYSLAVGSTGNLGLSVGLMGAALGFKTTVHMSGDARQWKKDLLRQRGVTVVEYPEDYSKAVAAGRALAAADPFCHFVDDESSRDLFLGYAVAGLRLKRQLADAGIRPDAAHPLCVYLPCGVGGGPGGVTFGLKLAFGDAVSCYFAEPTQAPAVILGLITGRDDAISGQDLGLPGKTAADGLAVSRPSALVCRAMRSLVSGLYTMRDDTLYLLLHHLFQTEGIFLEPSALAGFPGVRHVECGGFGPHPNAAQGTHLVWCTGGSLVPEQERHTYLVMGEKCANEAMSY